MVCYQRIINRSKTLITHHPTLLTFQENNQKKTPENSGVFFWRNKFLSHQFLVFDSLRH